MDCKELLSLSIKLSNLKNQLLWWTYHLDEYLRHGWMPICKIGIESIIQQRTIFDVSRISFPDVAQFVINNLNKQITELENKLSSANE